MSGDRPRLFDEFRRIARLHGLARRTEEAYLGWVRRYVRFHRPLHPRTLDGRAIRQFLVHLAAKRRLSASSRNQARAALLFLYRKVYGLAIENPELVPSAPRARRVPTVLTAAEIQRIHSLLEGTSRLLVGLLYGSGLRKSECLGLRVKDLHLEDGRIAVRDAKGNRDRYTLLPQRLVEPLRFQLDRALVHWQEDRRNCLPGVALPASVGNKRPSAGFEWGWYWVFPADHPGPDPEDRFLRRPSLHPSRLERHLRRAVRQAGITRPVTCHTFRHSFATHLLDAGYDIRTVQELLGHKSVRTTMIYTHVQGVGSGRFRSPLDSLPDA